MYVEQEMLNFILELLYNILFYWSVFIVASVST
jgi:hypothetical protein